MIIIIITRSRPYICNLFHLRREGFVLVYRCEKGVTHDCEKTGGSGQGMRIDIERQRETGVERR